MGAITAELVDTGERRGAHGRRMMPAERRAQLVEAYRASGLTMAAFARREGVKYPTFVGWVAKEQQQQPVRTKVPIRFAEMRLPLAAASEPSHAMEVRLPDGTVLRGSQVADVVALVRALRG